MPLQYKCYFLDIFLILYLLYLVIITGMTIILTAFIILFWSMSEIFKKWNLIK